MKAQEEKILSLISNNDVTFFIPPYQRNYSWTANECSVLFDDIIKTYEENRSTGCSGHFFGTITYYVENTMFGQPVKCILIDGQQRITTVMLFLAAVRDLIKDSNAKKYIQEQYLINSRVSSDSDFKVKLRQIELDWTTYLKIILHKDIDENDKKSNVYQVYAYFCKKILEYTKGDDTIISSLVNDGLSGFEIIKAELQPNLQKWENPQEVFESMNSLGKPLSLSDLVRNYLLLGMTATEQTQYYNDCWLKIEKILHEQTMYFIRDYMQIKKQYWCKKASTYNAKELYSEFKLLFANAKSVDILRELSEYVDDYKVIVFNDYEIESKKINELIKNIRELNCESMNSFLTEMLHQYRNNEFTEKDMIDIFEAVFIYIARKRLANLNSSENRFAKLTKNINELKTATDKKQKMFEMLSNMEYSIRLANDNEVRQTLLEANFYNFKYSRFFLSLLEEHISKININSCKTVTIEHIMPQTLTNEWKIDLGINYTEIHTRSAI